MPKGKGPGAPFGNKNAAGPHKGYLKSKRVQIAKRALSKGSAKIAKRFAGPKPDKHNFPYLDVRLGGTKGASLIPFYPMQKGQPRAGRLTPERYNKSTGLRKAPDTIYFGPIRRSVKDQKLGKIFRHFVSGSHTLIARATRNKRRGKH